MACIFSELPKGEACSPLILLLQVPAVDQLGTQSLRKRLHRAHSLCSLTEADHLRNSATKEQGIVDEPKLEMRH